MMSLAKLARHGKAFGGDELKHPDCVASPDAGGKFVDGIEENLKRTRRA